jgi:pimeloyl-ACP methyl ester carboxylesterase
MKIIKNYIVAGKHQKPIITDVFFEENHTQKKIVIFCHGYKGFKDWGPWNLMAETFANAGFFFIKFNFSHNGGTVEQPIDFPDLEAFGTNNYSKELDDLTSVINWISTNSDFKNEVKIHDISLIGHSRGGGIVLLKTNEDVRIKKVVTLAGVSDYESRFPKESNFQEWSKKGVYYVKNGRTKQEMPHFYQFYEDFDKNKERLNIENATRKLKIPQLIIHGDGDTSVSIKEGQKLHNWNPDSQFEVIQGANHVFNTSHPWKGKRLSKEMDEVVINVVNFINK